MEEIQHRGTLSRRGGFFGTFKPFSYIVKENYLFEYKAGANTNVADPLNMYELRGAIIEDAAGITGNRGSFIFHTLGGKSIFFNTVSIAEKNRWMEVLSDAAQVNKKQKASSVHSSSGQSPSQQAVMPTPQQPNLPSYADVTSDRRSENSAMSSSKEEEQLPILGFLESFTDPVIVANSLGIIIAMNSNAEKLFGFSSGQAKGQNLTVLMPEPYKSQHDGYLFRHEKFGTEKLIGKTRMLQGERQNKEVFPLQISLGKLPVPGYFIATLREVDAETLERRKKKTATVVSSSQAIDDAWF